MYNGCCYEVFIITSFSYFLAEFRRQEIANLMEKMTIFDIVKLIVTDK